MIKLRLFQLASTLLLPKFAKEEKLQILFRIITKQIYDGFRRMQAYRSLGFKEIDGYAIDIDDVKLGERDASVQRKGFTPP